MIQKTPLIKVYKDGELLDEFEFFWSYVDFILEKCAGSKLVIDLYPDGSDGPVIKNLFRV